MARDSAVAIRQKLTTADTLQLGQLVEGHLVLSEGRKAYDDLKIEAAIEPLTKAGILLRRADSPLHGWADFFRSFCIFRQGNLKKALADFGQIRVLAGHQYPILAAHADWMIGLIRNYQGQFGLSLASYNQALATFKRTRQAQNIATLHFLIAEDLSFLGDFAQAEGHLHEALRSFPQIFKRRWAVTILKKAAETARSTENPLAALQFLNEAVDTAIQDGKPAVLSEALLFTRPGPSSTL